MKYLKATVLVGIDEKEIETWSEHADVTFCLARLFHSPEEHMYLIDHSTGCSHCGEDLFTEEQVKDLKYSVITEEGGV